MTEKHEDSSAPALETRSRTAFLWIIWLMVGAVVAGLLRLRGAADVDLWLHLRVGEELREGVRFQRLPDPLALLADRPYLPTQWLSEVAGSVVHEAFGVAGLHVLRWLAIVLLAGAVHRTVRRWAGPGTSVVVTLGVLVATAAGWGERPQLLGLVLEAVVVLLWSGTLQDGRARWSLVPLTWLWAMCHGSWPIGVGVGGLVVLALLVSRERPPVAWRPVLGVLVATAVVPALTPLGPRLLTEPFAVGTAARATVNEWQTPSPGNPLLVLVVLLAALSLVRCVRRRPVDLPTVLLALAAVVLAAWSVRTIAVGALLLSPALARSLAPTVDVPRTRAEAWPALVTALVVLVVPGVVLAGPEDGPLPDRVDTAVAALPPGTPVAVDAFASGWVLWAHPGVRLLRDLRAEVYTPATAREYEDFFSARAGWQEYATRHDVRALVVRAGEPIDRALAADGGWVRTEAEGTWVLWTRSGSG